MAPGCHRGATRRPGNSSCATGLPFRFERPKDGTLASTEISAVRRAFRCSAVSGKSLCSGGQAVHEGVRLVVVRRAALAAPEAQAIVPAFAHEFLAAGQARPFARHMVMGADIFFRCLVGFEGRWRCAGHPVFPFDLPDKVPLRPCGAGRCPELAYAFLPHRSRFATSEPVKAAGQRLTFFCVQAPYRSRRSDANAARPKPGASRSPDGTGLSGQLICKVLAVPRNVLCALRDVAVLPCRIQGRTERFRTVAAGCRAWLVALSAWGRGRADQVENPDLPQKSVSQRVEHCRALGRFT